VESVGLEHLINFSYWQGKKVLVTGHSGFKGWWLSQFLSLIGAKVYGLANISSSEYLNRPFLLEDDVFNEILLADINDKLRTSDFVAKVKPDVVFHLAAQPSVIEGHVNPIQTMETNFLGTVNLLFTLRKMTPDANIVVITTDKVYENDSNLRPFVESDDLAVNGDPYSASKAFADLFSCNFDSIVPRQEFSGKILVARAGNVIGGGDWLPSRLIPDCVKAVYSNQNLTLRYPNSTRPWQNILDVIFGYILLAQSADHDKISSGSSFNFGPEGDTFVNSKTLCELFLEHFQNKPKIVLIDPTFQEKANLSLNTAKSLEQLKWVPRLDIAPSLKLTADWYKACISGASAKSNTQSQINWYLSS